MLLKSFMSVYLCIVEIHVLFLILHSVISCWQHEIVYHGDIYSNHQSLLIRAYYFFVPKKIESCPVVFNSL